MGKKIEVVYEAILAGEIQKAELEAEKALAVGIEPLELAQKGCIQAIENVGRLFEIGEYFLPQLIASAEAMKAAMSQIEPMLGTEAKKNKMGAVVIGTVAGDIHDIGKNMVAVMLQANGFEVFDLGVNVSSEKFIDKVRELDPDVIGLSALLTTTMLCQKKVIDLLVKEGLRNKVKVIIGGAPVSEEWAKEIGADAFAEDAVRTVNVVKKLIS